MDILAVILSIIATAIATAVGVYLKEKFKNQATKEDVGEITKNVKQVETEYSAILARLNSKLTTASQVNSKQFDLELGIYREIWSSLVEVRTSFLLHRELATVNRQDSAEQNDKSNFEKLITTLRSLNAMVDNQRPFYSPEIWKALKELCDLISEEGMKDIGSRALVVSLPTMDEKRKYRDEKAAKSGEICEAVNEVGEAIRKRIFEFGNPT